MKWVADVERGQQRAAIHWGKVSTIPLPHDPCVRTSAQQEIEGCIYESVGQGEELYCSGSETLCVSDHI